MLLLDGFLHPLLVFTLYFPNDGGEITLRIFNRVRPRSNGYDILLALVERHVRNQREIALAFRCVVDPVFFIQALDQDSARLDRSNTPFFADAAHMSDLDHCTALIHRRHQDDQRNREHHRARQDAKKQRATPGHHQPQIDQVKFLILIIRLQRFDVRRNSIGHLVRLICMLTNNGFD